jgi:hypothetical protein
MTDDYMTVKNQTSPPLTASEHAYFASAVITAIQASTAEGETKTSFMQQLGLMTLLFHMALKDEEFTTNNILRISKLHRVSLLRIFNELNEKGLLEREQITNIQNRGHTFRYLFSTSLLRRIAALKASDAKKKSG